MRPRARRVIDESEAIALAEKRWGQLCRLEPTPFKRERKLQDFLQRKGVSYDLSKQILATILEGEPEPEDADVDEMDDGEGEDAAFNDALSLAENRWRSLLRLESNDRKRKQKLRNFLQRRGYRFDMANRVLEVLAPS